MICGVKSSFVYGRWQLARLSALADPSHLVSEVGSLLACRAGGPFVKARAEEDAKSLPKTGSGDRKAGVDLQMPASCGGLQRGRGPRWWHRITRGGPETVWR